MKSADTLKEDAKGRYQAISLELCGSTSDNPYEKGSVIIIPKTKNAALPPIFGIVWSFCCFLFVYLLKAPEKASAAVTESLLFCAARLIPAILPFMILTELSCSSGLAAAVSKLFSHTARLFGLPYSGISAVLLGAIGGFPNGAIVTRRLLDSGEITAEDAERLIAFSNNSGLAFCVSGIGASLYKSPRLGLRLWLIQLGSALLLAALTAKHQKGTSRPNRNQSEIKPDMSCGRLLGLFSNAVSSSAMTIIRVCAFSVFFGVIGQVITDILPELAALAAASICELSLAARLAAKLGKLGIPFLAFALGFGGLSVHSQIAAVLIDSGISMRRLFFFKSVQGLISALIAVIIC